MTEEENDMVSEGSPVDDQLPGQGPEPTEEEQKRAAMQAAINEAQRDMSIDLNQMLSDYAKRLPVLMMAKILSNSSIDMLAQQGVFSARHEIADLKEEMLKEQMRPKIELARY